jgi:hypothetical protein
MTMLHRMSEFTGVSIHASDAVLGAVRDVYFDEMEWKVRYFVADTGTWLPGRIVLLAPEAVTELDVPAGELRVNLTKEQIERSPGIETHQPVSRQRELALRDYYGWPIYYPQGSRDLTGMPTTTPGRVPDQEDTHLQSAADVAGYYIHARDGDLGHIEDFIVDEGAWAIRSLIVDTRNWWPGKKVLVEPRSIEKIDWASSKAWVAMSRDEIRNGPEFHASEPLEEQVAAAR